MRPVAIAGALFLLVSCTPAAVPPVPSPTVQALPAAQVSPTAEPTSAPTATPRADSAAPTLPPSERPTPAPPRVSDEPAALARQLEVAERAVRNSAVSVADLAWMGHLQQLVYRRLVERSELRAPVLDALPEDLRGAAKANVDAGADLRALVTPRTTLPPWRIDEPAPADELLAHYRAAESEFGVPWMYLAAIHLVETRMGRIRGTSTAGAQGPMQFLPSTWAAYGEGDINDNGDAIRAAARYLKANGAPARMANALFRYNNSDRYVRAVSAYAENMRADPATFRGYYHWQVYYITTSGDRLLPVGYVGE